MSEILSFSKKIPSIYIKLHHDFDHDREKSQTKKKLGEKQSFLARMEIFHPVRRATFPMCSAFLQLILEALPCTKFVSSGLVRNFCLCSF